MGGTVRYAVVTDGLSNTLLMGERGIPDDQYWGWFVWGTGDPGIQDGTGDALLATQNGLAPGNSLSPADTDVEHYWSYHPSGAQFAFLDGSQHFITYDIDFSVFTALGTRAGQEVIDKNQY
jgi:prepilin-type processing-associated H-X9-DG protein